MRGCFICGGHKSHGKFTVGVWSAVNTQNRFGLCSVDPTDNLICCSFREGDFKTEAEALDAAGETDVDELYGEHASMNEYHNCDEYGPPDSDPFDLDCEQY